MRYRLRTIMILLAIAPPVLGYLASLLFRAEEGPLRFNELPDLALVIGGIGWIAGWLTLASRQQPE